MSGDEFKTRATQELNKRWDAVRTWLGISLVPAAFGPSHGEQPKFFFASSDVPGLADLLRQRLPDEAERIVLEAERICSHKFDLLGYERVDYGAKIDWHLDAVHEKRSPRQLWYAIDLFDFERVGDLKVTWELNRHQHLVTLAKACCLTGQDRFAREAIQQWYDWQQENRYPIGVNWASSLEVAFRTLSWIWMWRLLAACQALPAGFEHELRRALGLNARHIEHYLSTYSSPNTHLIGELTALLFIGILLPELSVAARWRQTAWQALLREAEHQVRPDGLYFEQSTHYHVYTLDFFLHSRLLSGLNGITTSKAFDLTLEKMLEILATLSCAGPTPRFGDDDGGRVFNGRRNRAEHLADPLATGAVLFGRSEFAAAARRLREETLWLMGADGVRRFDELYRGECSQTSRAFERSGIYVMASSEPVSQRLVITCGTPGTMSGGHGHADLLSGELTIGGRPWLIDPGTFSFASASERDTFRGTAAHNTLQVDGLSQADPAGPFAWRSLPTAIIDGWSPGETYDLFIASHEGYGRLPDPVLHRRWVFHLKSNFWLVRDLALGKRTHQLDIFWHLAPDLVARESEVGGACCFARSEQPLNLLFLTRGDSDLIQELVLGSCSPAYGRQEPGPVLHLSTRTGLPAELSTLLVLTTRALDGNTLTRIRDDRIQATVSAYRYDSLEGRHYMFFCDSSSPWKLADWSSDAQFLYIGLPADSEGTSVILCNGSYASFQDRRMLDCGRSVARYEWSARGQQAFCSDDSALDAFAGEAAARLREALDSTALERK